MKVRSIYSGLAAVALTVGGLATAVPAASATPAQASSPSARTAVRACATHPAAGSATCFAVVLGDSSGRVIGSAAPLAGAFGPADIQAAYNLTGLSGSGATVAIVDAYGYPTLESDLAAFRSTYGLPACTIANGCLSIKGQSGGAPPGGSDQGWDLEQALDVDMVSAACPDCHILVVQGNAASFSDLETAVNTAAATAGVVAISNSYGGGNGPNNSAYDHKGIAITAATGDNGFQGGFFPASDTHVIAVGGTSVFADGSPRGYSETAWSGAGSGCSASNKKPKWQKKVNTTCSTDASSDVSAAADPSNGGLNVYDSQYGGFIQVGGTSESSPLIASVYALSGKTTGYPAKYLYKDPADLYDVTTGSNGSCGAPLCQAGVGWDGPTGLGTPNGIAAF